MKKQRHKAPEELEDLITQAIAALDYVTDHAIGDEYSTDEEMDRSFDAIEDALNELSSHLTRMTHEEQAARKREEALKKLNHPPSGYPEDAPGRRHRR